MKRRVPKQLIVALNLYAFCQLACCTDTLLRGQNITVGQSLISSGGTFELGFFSRNSVDHFLAIWYKVSPDAVVWVANRDSPLNSTSGILTIHNNWSVVLYDSSERMLWSSSTNLTSGANHFSPILQLNESGNLILKDQTSNTIIWQSFDHPTNTLIAGMKLGKNLITGFQTVFTSWKNVNDPSEGKYTTKVGTEGSPEIVIWDHDQIRFRTGPWNGLYFGDSIQMVAFGEMFAFSFVWDKDEVSYGFEAKSTSNLARIILTNAGILRWMVWEPNQKNWNEFWSGPKDECDYYAKCGNFGICQPDSIATCSCLTGFEIAAPTEWNILDYSGGCKRKMPLGCKANSDGFYELKGVKLPNSLDATVYTNISVEECQASCLMNCSCLAYSQSDITGKVSRCVMWNTELVDTKYVNGGIDVLHVKVSKSELGASNNKLAVKIGIVSGTVLLILLICLVSYLFWTRKRFLKPATDRREKSLELDSFNCADHPVYDMEVILHATDNFSTKNVVGQGGFGTVYKGKLPSGQEIAVKRLSNFSTQGLNEFMNEVTLIAKLQHRNLLKLLGCCTQNNERILIYEFMTNRSLDFFIFDPEKRASLSWTRKFEIIIGIARGLLYLHHDSRFNIIHRDLKAANVLLDEDMNPKISDFGTARLFEGGQAVISTQIVIGTRGYMSPEYVMEGVFSVKSDVYSFGVMLLEIISGKRNEGNQCLITYAWKLWEEQNILELLDEAVESSHFTTQLPRCMHVGLLCVQDCPDDRPTMSSVFMMLSSDNMVLPAPKKPLIISRSIKSVNSGSQFSEYDSVGVVHLSLSGIEGR